MARSPADVRGARPDTNQILHTQDHPQAQICVHLSSSSFVQIQFTTELALL